MLRDPSLMGAYYNEHDPYAAQWLRNLIAAGHIASGEVDERSVVDVRADDLRGFKQCHFFAGIGVWSYALRLAGWPDDREVWTGSCPCQPFSAAGKRGGVEDERHLWPEFFRLISIARPRTVFGEQVASKDGLAWLDIVSADLEGAGYACGAVDTCAAGFGAPHIRQRLYFVADALDHAADARRPGTREHGGGSSLRAARSEQHGVALAVADASVERRQQIGRSASGDEEAHGREPHGDHVASSVSAARSLADADGRNASAEGLQRSWEHGFEQEDGSAYCRHCDGWYPESSWRWSEGKCPDCGVMGDTDDARSQGRRLLGTVDGGDRASECPSRTAGVACGRISEGPTESGQFSEHAGRFPTNGFWRDADWLPCIDGKARPVEPGTFPLAHGAPARVGRLRAYGNAINARQAQEFISAYLK